MYAKKPIIVIGGTWLADIAKKYHAGLVIRPYSSSSILSAIKIIKSNENQFAKLVKNTFTNFEKDNSWERLIEVMLNR
jgi:hydrogenase maturation factor